MNKLIFATGARDSLPIGTLVTVAIFVVCEIVSNLLLTSTIALKIWFTIRSLETTPSRSYRPPYNHVITIIVESGFIMLADYTIFAGLLLDNGTSGKWTTALSILGAMSAQISALVPLLIIVRIGLGRSFEERPRHITMARDTFRSEGRSQPLRINHQLSTFRATRETDQNSGMDIALQSSQHLQDEESGTKMDIL
ncbi:hypothetical protein PM082_019784 [Marasmius tenuissimus]|nr:hypothetical protein PM082_019784 [Marasmius tenuissimus]